MKQKDIEHLTKMMAHLNCALEHLDNADYQRIFKQKDKLIMKRFMEVSKKKIEPLVDAMYDNSEVYFQSLQVYLQESLDTSMVEMLENQIKKEANV